jgi:hypothetical protein
MSNTFFRYVTAIAQIKQLQIVERIGDEDKFTTVERIVGTNERLKL